MTLDEYLQQQGTYAEFAATVIHIVEAGLSLHPDVPRPLTSQSRAKDAVSLGAKLCERELLVSRDIETEIKDLAGCRLIFYTNSDADRFLQSRIVFDNFVVDWDNTKIHHAVGAEPKVEELYRARHYIISMKPDSENEMRFGQLLTACASLAANEGLKQVVACVNAGQPEAYRHLLSMGFRVQRHGVTMHCPNEDAYNQTASYILDDLR